MRLDETRPFGRTFGDPHIVYEQDGRYFNGQKDEINSDGSLVVAPTVDSVVADPLPVVDAPPKLRDELIIDAIRALDSNDPAHFTQAGIPRVGAIEKILGFDIGMVERDMAWEQVNA